MAEKHTVPKAVEAAQKHLPKTKAVDVSISGEHYTAMRNISSLTLKDGNDDVEDVMKFMMESYETLYNQIVKEHKNGDRLVSYELTGKRTLTLEEDLAGIAQYQ